MARNRSLDDGVNVAEEILDSSMRLFNERGYDGTSIRDIAVATGISSSTLYHHYKNKQEILYSGLCRFMIAFNAAIIPGLSEPEVPPLDRIIRAAALHVQLSVQRSTELRHVRQFKSSLLESQLRDLLDMQWEYQGALKAVIKEGCAAGDLATEDPDLTTMAILDMLNGVRGWYSAIGPMSLDDINRHYATLIRKTLSGTLQ